MLDPNQVEGVINKADMVLDMLKKQNKLVFNAPIVRVKVAFLGYQFIWNGWDREKLTFELLDIGFDNLTTIQIIEGLVHLKRQMEKWKVSPKRVTDPVKLAAMEARMKASVRKNLRAGKY